MDVNKRVVGMMVLVLLICGSWVWLYSHLRPKGIDLDGYVVLGEAAAQETTKLLHNSGRLVIVDADFADYKILAPINEAQIRSFRKTIRKGQLKIAANEKVSMAPPMMARTGIFMQAGQISNLMARHADADALVLFVGLAGPADLKEAGSEGKKPKLILVSNYEPYCKTLLEKRAIQLAIVPRADEGEDRGKKTESAQQWFERHYLVATPERVNEIPD
jgi:hypothetical protein